MQKYKNLQYDIGENLDDLWFDENFLNVKPKSCSLKEGIESALN